MTGELCALCDNTSRPGLLLCESCSQRYSAGFSIGEAENEDVEVRNATIIDLHEILERCPDDNVEKPLGDKPKKTFDELSKDEKKWFVPMNIRKGDD